MLSVVTYIVGALTLFSAGSILFMKNVFTAALMLLVTLLSVAVLYVVLAAEFIAVTQVLVYAGGILTLILFGIMLTSNRKGRQPNVESGKWYYGLMLAVPMLYVLIRLFLQHSFEPRYKLPATSGMFSEIGLAIMTDYLLAFELSGVLLLVVLVGAIVTASAYKKTSHDSD